MCRGFFWFSTSTCGVSCVELLLFPLCFAASIPCAQTVETSPCGPWAIITSCQLYRYLVNMVVVVRSASTECGMFARRYINGCTSDVFSVVNMHLVHLKLYVVCINGRSYVCCSECYVVSNECDEPTSCLVQPIGAHGGEVMYLGCFCFSGELSFLDSDDSCMCVVNKNFELLELVFNSVYVDLKYNTISLTFTAESVCLRGVCSHVVVICLSVRLSGMDLFRHHRLYEEQRQPPRRSAWPACPKTVNRAPITGA